MKRPGWRWLNCLTGRLASSSANLDCCAASSRFYPMRRDLRRELRDLRSEVAEARKQVPKVPAIESRLRAEAELRRELEATKRTVTMLRASASSSAPD